MSQGPANTRRYTDAGSYPHRVAYKVVRCSDVGDNPWNSRPALWLLAIREKGIVRVGCSLFPRPSCPRCGKGGGLATPVATRGGSPSPCGKGRCLPPCGNAGGGGYPPGGKGGWRPNPLVAKGGSPTWWQGGEGHPPCGIGRIPHLVDMETLSKGGGVPPLCGKEAGGSRGGKGGPHVAALGEAPILVARGGGPPSCGNRGGSPSL